MDQQIFAENLFKEIVNGNLNIYRDLFENTKIEQSTDLYWKEALEFYQCLSPEGRNVFFKIIRQVEIDTASNIFGILDGSSTLVGLNDELVLSLGKDNEKINGELQDLFLEIAEND